MVGFLFNQEDAVAKAKATLAQRFMVPPFTVLNTRGGWWQDRRKAWISLGIQSELGRGGNLLQMSDTILDVGYKDDAARARREQKSAMPGRDGGLSKNSVYLVKTQGGRYISEKEYAEGSDTTANGTSIFDPVLCELVYSWFCPPNGTILDPFAGGSVRGIVAGKLGRYYTGIDLAATQVGENVKQAETILEEADKKPVWYIDDSLNIGSRLSGVFFDFVFSCPPYFDLEMYSDDPKDLSNQTWPQFKENYKAIIRQVCLRLKPNRFACFVVGDVRNKEGLYRGLPSLTVACFEECGLHFYNEAILVNSVGSLPLRVGRSFQQTRKLGKTHQQVLVFVRGDPEKATAACGLVDVADVLE